MALEPRQSRTTVHSPDEPRIAASSLNDTQAPYASDRSLGQLFEAQARRTPDAIAVRFEGQDLTYGELNRRANQVAYHLRRHGVGTEVFVGLHLERSLEMVVGLLGILKAGAAYVPLEPTFPAARLAFILGEARPPVVLSQARIASGLPGHEARVVRLDADWGPIAKESAADPDGGAGPENLAYLMYTSGSTGQPKGVQIGHRAVVNLLESLRRQTGFTAADTLLAVTTIAFDIAGLELYMPLLAGGRVVVASAETVADGGRLRGVLDAGGITVMQATPATWRLLIAAGWRGTSGLRILCGGEALPRELAEQLLSRAASVLNVYGPTETTIWSMTHPIESGPPGSLVSIGRPIANTQVYFLDEALRPVNPGEAGELCIAGDGLARGYFLRPELTADRFVPDPWSQRPGARLYRTGDLARHRDDGAIEFIGRKDRQAKIRGFRVEPGEIEAVLEQHPGVRDVAVNVIEDGATEKRLVAYVVARASAPPRSGDLRRFLATRLPAHMVPSAFVLLDRFPLTPNGKVDRKALPAPPTDLHAGGAYEAARPGVETAVAAVWSEVLGLDRVGRQDSFFEVGGHSLKAAQIISRLRETIGVDLPFRSFFQSPTLAAMAAMVERLQTTAVSAPVATIPRAPRHVAPPLSFSQERVWFIRELGRDSRAYNFQAAIRITGPLDPVAFEASLAEMVRRHEILRTTFGVVGGRPAQIIHEPWTVRLPLVDLSTVDAVSAAAGLDRIVQAEFHTTFDLERLPLFRWTLVRLSATEHVLVHVEHHVTHDGWSYNVLLRELLEIYAALSSGRRPELPELPIQFADYAVWQHQWLQSAEADRQLAYWRQKLAGAPPLLELPADRPRPAVPTFRGAGPRQDVPGPLASALRSLAREEGVTLFMVMMAGFAALMHRYTGQEDVCIGSGVASRGLKETESLIGMTVNNVVVRNDLSGDVTVQELLARTREVVIDASANQDLPFDRVVEALRPQRELGYNPLFQVMFSFHDAPMPTMPVPGLTVSDLISGLAANGSAKFDLNVIVAAHAQQRIGAPLADEDNGLTVVWEHSTDLFDDATIVRLMAHYARILEAMVADPGQRVADLPLLSRDERRQILVAWNDTRTDYPRERCVGELFEAQARRTPDAIAVSFEGAALTYGELNRRANQLARHLRRHGVGPEVLVGLHVERSLEMVVGLLGILKAGGAYVPLDPTFPVARLAFVLGEVKAPVVLTQARLAVGSPGTELEFAL